MGKKLTTEQFIENSIAIHKDKYGYSKVVYKDNKTNVELECPVHGSFFQQPKNHLKGQGCPKCAIIRQSKKLANTTEEFVEKARAFHGDKYGYSRVVYVNSDINVELECPVHGFFWQRPDNHLKGRGCPKCGIIKRSESMKKSTEEFIQKSKFINGDKYGYSRVVYVNIKTNVELECPVHGFFWQRAKNHLDGQGCPKCKASKGERIVREFLEENNINYIHEHKFPDCKDKGLLKFDFYIPSLNLCIEYDGEHHYRPVLYCGNLEAAKKRYEDTVRCDKIKKEYCKDNKIHLINVPYSINDIPEYIMKEMKRKKLEFTKS